MSLRRVLPNILYIVLCFCLVCLRLVYPMLPVSLDCPFLIASSVFFSVYLKRLFFIVGLIMLFWIVTPNSGINVLTLYLTCKYQYFMGLFILIYFSN